MKFFNDFFQGRGFPCVHLNDIPNQNVSCIPDPKSEGLINILLTRIQVLQYFRIPKHTTPTPEQLQSTPELKNYMAHHCQFCYCKIAISCLGHYSLTI